MADIIVIASWEINEKTKRKELLASHGINADTDEVVVLPVEHPESLGAQFDPNIGEYVIRENAAPKRTNGPRR